MSARSCFFVLFAATSLLVAGGGLYRSGYIRPDETAAVGFGLSPPEIRLGRLARGAAYDGSVRLLRSRAAGSVPIGVRRTNTPENGWLSVLQADNLAFADGAYEEAVRIRLEIPAGASAGEYALPVYFIAGSGASAGVAINTGAKLVFRFSLPSEPGLAILSGSAETLVNYRGKFLAGSSTVYYVDPAAAGAYILSGPADIKRLIGQTALGMSDEDLEKIPLGLDRSAPGDRDYDGLPDEIEEAIGTDPDRADSDRDGWPDGMEAANGYDPRGPGAWPADLAWTRRFGGYLLIQAEGRGQAWYVDPTASRRHYLGADAWNVVKELAQPADPALLAALR